MNLFCRSFLLLSIAALIAPARSAFAQSFLEKLEAAVRQRLSEPEQPPEPQVDRPKTQSTNELPPPTPAPDPTQQVPSVLERPGALVPPPTSQRQSNQLNVQPQSRGDASSPTSGRIYLGIEAEEIPGGGIGVRVANVTQGSPAWKAGFEVGDRIAGINGFAVTKLDEMVEQLRKASPGQAVRFLTTRGAQNLELIAVLTDAELAERIVSNEPVQDMSGPPWLGVMVNDLTPSFRTQFGIGGYRGAAVTSVVAGSPANLAGIQAGDAIVSLNGKPVESARDLLDWMAQAKPGDAAQIVFYRGGSTQVANMVLDVSPENRVRRRSSNRAPMPDASVPGNQRDTRNGIAATPSAQTPELNPSAPNLRRDMEADTQALLQANAEAEQRIAELEQKVQQLEQQLKTAESRLEQTQQNLKQILNALGSGK